MFRVLREHFPKDIAVFIEETLLGLYLSDWKRTIAAVNADFIDHVEIAEGMNNEFVLLYFVPMGMMNEDDDNAFYPFFFNYRSQRDLAEVAGNREHRLYRICHVPTGTITNARLPINY